MLGHKILEGICRVFSTQYDEAVYHVQFKWGRDADGRTSLLKMFIAPDKQEALEMQQRILQRAFKSSTMPKQVTCNEKKSDDRTVDGL